MINILNQNPKVFKSQIQRMYAKAFKVEIIK